MSFGKTFELISSHRSAKYAFWKLRQLPVVTSYLEHLNVNKVYRNMPRGDNGGKSKDSGIRCGAANCENTNADGVSLHTFPKDPTL